MRWVDMRGPVGPIIKAMAGYYASRSGVDRDDLIQEAWLALLSRPHGMPAHVAWSAISNAVARDRTWRKWLAARPSPPTYETARQLDARLDVEAILAACPPHTREAARLMFWEGLSRVETARRLGVRESTISRRFQALAS